MRKLLIAAVLPLAFLAGCQSGTTGTAQTAVNFSTDIAATCQAVQAIVAAAGQCLDGGAANTVATYKPIVDASCSVAGQIQLVTNDAIAAVNGSTPTNSGNSVAWLQSVAQTVKASAPIGCAAIKAVEAISAATKPAA